MPANAPLAFPFPRASSRLTVSGLGGGTEVLLGKGWDAARLGTVTGHSQQRAGVEALRSRSPGPPWLVRKAEAALRLSPSDLPLRLPNVWGGKEGDARGLESLAAACGGGGEVSAAVREMTHLYLQG